MRNKGQIKKEMVNHPKHYVSGGLEVIDVIEAFHLGFSLGNVVKYVLRCGRKDDPVQELEKAKWYLERQIEQLKAIKQLKTRKHLKARKHFKERINE